MPRPSGDNVAAAVDALSELASEHEVVVTHGNGPQVGLLALQGEAYRQVAPYPLDVLGAESEGMIGYLLDQELVNGLGGRPVATLLTQVIVDADDPAFSHPTKFIGPIYERTMARCSPPSAAGRCAGTAARWRRVVAVAASRGRSSSSPRSACSWRPGCSSSASAAAASRSSSTVTGGCSGVEAVIDKDRAAALLAYGLEADALLLLTDVAGDRARLSDAGRARRSHVATPAELRALDLPAGSMGPKAEAAAWFAETTGGIAAIGALADAAAVLRRRPRDYRAASDRR